MAYHKDSAPFGECKWTNAHVDVDALTALTDKTRLFNYQNVWLWLFAKAGFTERLIMEAGNHDNIRLVSFEEMI